MVTRCIAFSLSMLFMLTPLYAKDLEVVSEEIARLSCGTAPTERKIDLSLVKESASDPDSLAPSTQVNVLSVIMKNTAESADEVKLWQDIFLSWKDAHPIPSWTGNLLCDRQPERAWLIVSIIQGFDLALKAYLLDLAESRPSPKLGPDLRVGRLLYKTMEFTPLVMTQRRLSPVDSCLIDRLQATWNDRSILIRLKPKGNCKELEVVLDSQAAEFLFLDYSQDGASHGQPD